ncbi:MAG: FKBP-type peptidyl-prolyl cis-trans isomerase [Pseudomonadales bacterium]
MQKIVKLTAVSLMAVALVACDKPADKAVEVEVEVEVAAEPVVATAFATDEQKLSYGMGMNLGGQLGGSGFDVDIDALTAGITDGIAGNDPQIAEDVLLEASKNVMATLQAKAEAEAAVAGGENESAGLAYLAENATKEGVVTTETGLQYKVLVAGDGAMPTAEDTVTVNYKGTLIDGTEFDSSYSRGEPASFPVNAVIAGWTEALQLMKVGSKYELYIPSELAYGNGGTGPIGPNSTLIFEVDLLSIAEQVALAAPVAAE